MRNDSGSSANCGEAQTAPSQIVRVAVDAPQHTGLATPLDYVSDRPLPPGTLVHVPLGRRSVPGIVWHGEPGGAEGMILRSVGATLGALPPLARSWRELVDFAAAYYQRSTGEVALSVLPPELRQLDDAQLANRIRKLHRSLTAAVAVPLMPLVPPTPSLTGAQADALAALAAMAATSLA